MPQILILLFFLSMGLILWDFYCKTYVIRHWPNGLAINTRIQYYSMYKLLGPTVYLVKESEDLLRNEYSFFFNQFEVPFNCNEKNPVCVVKRIGYGTKVISHDDIEEKYPDCRIFSSKKEFNKFIRK